jgi:hypothetical protein
MHAEEESEIGDVGEDDLARVGDLASVDCELDSSKAVEGGWVDIATAKAVEVVVRDLVNAVWVRGGLGATRVTVGVDTWSEVRVCNGEVGIPGMSESWNVRLVIVVGGGGRVGGGAEIGSVAEGGGAPYCMRREVEVAGGWWVGGA